MVVKKMGRLWKSTVLVWRPSDPDVTSTGTVDPASVFKFDSTITNFPMDVDMSTAFIPSFEMDLYESENFLTSAGQRLGIWHPHFGEKEREDLAPDNYKEFSTSLSKGERHVQFLLSYMIYAAVRLQNIYMEFPKL